MTAPQFGPNRKHTFDFETMLAFEVGAWLMAILAFPLETEVEPRKLAAEALCALQIKVTCEHDPVSADMWRQRFPICAAIDSREDKRRTRILQNRIWTRMLAARMSLGFFYENLSGNAVQLPPTMRRHSLNELSKLVQDQSNESDPENVERRTWRTSLPVIHLAAAYQVEGRALADGTTLTGID